MMRKLTMRPYQGDEDYWRGRAFLREVFMLNGRRQYSWDVCRWDYWRWHAVLNCEGYRPEDTVFLWETEDGALAAILNPEGTGEAFLQVHPAYRTPELEAEMVAVAEDCVAAARANGKRRLCVWAGERDVSLAQLLRSRGYRLGEWPEYRRRRSLDQPIIDAVIAPGYTVRSLGDRDELPARSWLSWKGFHPDEPDEDYSGWEWYLNVQRAPLYRRDLDLVAVAPDGELASFCTIWFDDVTRMGIFEPVATHPNYQRRGLGRAVMTEGLRRLKRMGATLALVGSYSVEAGGLYAAMGFTEYDLVQPWLREF